MFGVVGTASLLLSQLRYEHANHFHDIDLDTTVPLWAATPNRLNLWPQTCLRHLSCGAQLDTEAPANEVQASKPEMIIT
jgi:hypothetical protein